MSNRTYTDNTVDKQTGQTRICLYEDGQLQGAFNVVALQGYNPKTGQSALEFQTANKEKTQWLDNVLKEWVQKGIKPELK